MHIPVKEGQLGASEQIGTLNQQIRDFWVIQAYSSLVTNKSIIIIYFDPNLIVYWFFSGHKVKAYSSAPPWGSGSSDYGKWARAALLSGPPGIGKTTSATLVCRELGFSICELNASDGRSKRFLESTIKNSLGMQNLALMASGRSKFIDCF